MFAGVSIDQMFLTQMWPVIPNVFLSINVNIIAVLLIYFLIFDFATAARLIQEMCKFTHYWH